MTSEPINNGDVSQDRNHGFLIGLMIGGAVGAGLTILLAPRVAAELRQRVTDSAKTLGRAASERYQQTSARVVDAVGEVTRKGQGVRDDVLEAVASGAQKGAEKVERFAADHSTPKRRTS